MSTPRKRSEYAKAAEADIGAQLDLVDDAGRMLDSLKALEADYAARIDQARSGYSNAYQAAVDGGWKPAKLTRYGLPTPKAAAAGRYEPPAPKDPSGRPSLSVVRDDADTDMSG